MISLEQEQELLGGLQSGNPASREEAATQLFEALRGPLYQLALRMTGAPALADDVVQETFVQVLSSISGFRGEARLTTWMFRVAVRAALRPARRRSAEPLASPEQLIGATPTPDESLARAEGAARILALIAELPPPQRTVFSLAGLQGLPQTEVAAILGVPVGTVYSRLSQARETLKRRLLGDAERPRKEPASGAGSSLKPRSAGA